MHVRDYLGGHGSTFNCSITRVAPQRAAILAKIVIYDSSTLQYCCIRSICHNQVQVSHLFRLNRLGVQRTYERRSVAILIVPALNCFVPALELYPHVSTPWNYSTRGKKKFKEIRSKFPAILWYIITSDSHNHKAPHVWVAHQKYITWCVTWHFTSAWAKC